MRVGTGLTLIAIGAILTFAVTTSPPYWNLQITGLVLIATGVAALVIPRQGYGWLRRKMVLRPGSRGAAVTRLDETRYPSSLVPYPGPRPGSDAPEDQENRQAGARALARAPWRGEETETIEEFRRE